MSRVLLRRACRRTEDQFDDQNDHHHEFEHEGAALVELVDHEAVEILGGLQFLRDQVFVVGHADFGGCQLVKRAENMSLRNLMALSARSVSSFTSSRTVCSLVAARARRQRASIPVPLSRRGVHTSQFAGEQFVVVAEFQQLRVGVFQQLDGGLGARLAVVQETLRSSRSPPDRWDSRKCGTAEFRCARRRKAGRFLRGRFARCARPGKRTARRRRESRNLPHVENEVVLTQPFRIGLHQRRSGPLQFLADDAGGVLVKVDVPDPAAAQANQRVPVAGKRQLEDHAQDAVVVILDLAFQALAAVEHQRLNGFDHRGPLVADVSGSRMLEAGLLQGAGAEDLAQLVEPDFFANIELDQDED